ncbi:MAG TPA: hypothetical protein DD708_05005 [Deltaproteobacteria bacterium]|nr:hypothetical protein [Deltaproteobacteria bacterium]
MKIKNHIGIFFLLIIISLQILSCSESDKDKPDSELLPPVSDLDLKTVAIVYAADRYFSPGNQVSLTLQLGQPGKFKFRKLDLSTWLHQNKVEVLTTNLNIISTYFPETTKATVDPLTGLLTHVAPKISPVVGLVIPNLAQGPFEYLADLEYFDSRFNPYQFMNVRESITIEGTFYPRSVGFYDQYSGFRASPISMAYYPNGGDFLGYIPGYDIVQGTTNYYTSRLVQIQNGQLQSLNKPQERIKVYGGPDGKGGMDGFIEDSDFRYGTFTYKTIDSTQSRLSLDFLLNPIAL